MRRHWPSPLVLLDVPEPEIDAAAFFPPGLHAGGGMSVIWELLPVDFAEESLMLIIVHLQGLIVSGVDGDFGGRRRLFLSGVLRSIGAADDEAKERQRESDC
jgi:hypothetical protein